MAEEKQATLQDQFEFFSGLLDKNRSGHTITLWRSDYWMRQAKLIDDRHLTMTDTGIIWFKFSKIELTFEEWWNFLTELCETKNIDREEAVVALTDCGTPGCVPVTVPQYRNFFNNYKPKMTLIY